MYFILCILIDFGIITLLPFSFDRMLLNYTYKKVSNEDINIVRKFINILFFKWKMKIELQYQQNLKLEQKLNIDKTIDVQEIEVNEIKEEQQQIQLKPELKLLKFPEILSEQKVEETKQIENSENITNNENEGIDNLCSNKDLEKVRNIIWDYKDVDVAPSVNALIELTGLSRKTIQAAKKMLEKEGFITTKGTTTFVNTKDKESKNVSKVRN